MDHSTYYYLHSPSHLVFLNISEATVNINVMIYHFHHADHISAVFTCGQSVAAVCTW